MKKVNDFSKFLLEKKELENKPRLEESIIKVLNYQIEKELESSQIYRAMSTWLDDKGWVNGTTLFFNYADEELGHMSKIYKYLFEKNCKAVVPTVGKVKQDFKDVKELLELALEHEIEITENWNSIANLASKTKDNDTYSFALLFVNEQREEEDKIRNILDSTNLDMPNWKIDELFKELVG